MDVDILERGISVDVVAVDVIEEETVVVIVDVAVDDTEDDAVELTDVEAVVVKDELAVEDTVDVAVVSVFVAVEDWVEEAVLVNVVVGVVIWQLMKRPAT